MIKRIIPLLIVILVGCATPPQVLQTTPHHQLYLPLIVSGDGYAVGVVVLSGGVDKWGSYYHGGGIKVSEHTDRIADPLAPPDWSRIKAQTSLDTEYLANLNGSARWMTEGGYVCELPLPEWWELWAWLANDLVEVTGAEKLSIWNEPDTRTTALEYHIGCVGDDYAAGQAYAEFFNYVYAYVKERNPQVKIIAGELLNPWQPFTQGMLDHIDQLDGLAFHSYAWVTTSNMLPATIANLNYQSDAPLYLTETSLLYFDPSPAIEQAQADYYCNLLDLEGLEKAYWFTLEDTGWRNSAMLDGDRPKPVHTRYEQGCE